jgi:pullulanase/glycogen debranching enzyme
MPDNTALTHEAWNDGRQRALALHLRRSDADSSASHADCLLLLNASDQPMRFRLPEDRHWLLHIDTSTGAGTDQPLASEETVPAGCLWLASSQPLFIASRQP